MRYFRIIAMLVLCSDVTAYAVTLRLRAEDQGIWGAELRACQARITRIQCARITPLVMADNDISVEELTQLPVGKKIFINDDYLEPGFQVNGETIEEARAIFSNSPVPTTTASENNENEILLVQARESLREEMEEKAALQTEVEAKESELVQTRDQVTRTEADLLKATEKISALEKELAAVPAPKAGWLTWAQYSAVFILGIGLTLFFCMWWFKIFERNNRILPQYIRFKDSGGTDRGFKLRKDHAYDCVSCEKYMQEEGPRARERGKRIDWNNLEQHLREVEHSQVEIAPPIDRTIRRAS